MFQRSSVYRMGSRGRVFACLVGVLNVLEDEWGGDGVYDIQRWDWNSKCLMDIEFGNDRQRRGYQGFLHFHSGDDILR